MTYWIIDVLPNNLEDNRTIRLRFFTYDFVLNFFPVQRILVHFNLSLNQLSCWSYSGMIRNSSLVCRQIDCYTVTQTEYE